MTRLPNQQPTPETDGYVDWLDRQDAKDHEQSRRVQPIVPSAAPPVQLNEDGSYADGGAGQPAEQDTQPPADVAGE